MKLRGLSVRIEALATSGMDTYTVLSGQWASHLGRMRLQEFIDDATEVIDSSFHNARPYINEQTKHLFIF